MQSAGEPAPTDAPADDGAPEVVEDPVERLRVNKARLRDFYAKVDAAKATDDNLDRILIEYSTEQLKDALSHKYGAVPKFVVEPTN